MDAMQKLGVANRDLIINSKLPRWGSTVASVAMMATSRTTEVTTVSITSSTPADDDDEPVAEPPAKSWSALQKARNLSTAPAALPLSVRKKTLARKRAERKRG